MAEAQAGVSKNTGHEMVGKNMRHTKAAVKNMNVEPEELCLHPNWCTHYTGDSEQVHIKVMM